MRKARTAELRRAERQGDKVSARKNEGRKEGEERRRERREGEEAQGKIKDSRKELMA